MRKLAVEYVDSSRFSVCSPEMVDALVAHGLRLDHAYSVWVIQHCWKPADDLARIKQSLKTKGNFLILNTRSRALPVSG